MKVMTVLGPVDVEDLGITLTHEHVILALDWPGMWPDISHRPDLVWQKVSIENLGELRRNDCAVRDNVLLNDVEHMSSEVELFKKAGGGAIMEVSNYGLGGEPAKLKVVSQRTGVHIMAGTGFYLGKTLPDEIKNMSVEQMVDLMLRDIYEGFPGTDVKAGFLGEVATSHSMTDVEERSLRAAARVQRDTGLAMNIHIGLNMDMCRKAIKILKEEKANPRKVAFAHCDGPAPLERYEEIVDEGIYVELDCFGYEFYVDNGAYDSDKPWYYANDGERIRTVKMLVDNGLADSVLLSHDVCYKTQTVRYGGYGYAHLLENIIPMLEHIGVPKETTYKMMKENPARFLKGE